MLNQSQYVGDFHIGIIFSRCKGQICKVIRFADYSYKTLNISKKYILYYPCRHKQDYNAFASSHAYAPTQASSLLHEMDFLSC